MLPGCLALSDEREPVVDLFLPPLECGGVGDLRRCPLLLRPAGVSDRLLDGGCPGFEEEVGAFLGGGEGSRLFVEDECWPSPLRTTGAFLLGGGELPPFTEGFLPLYI